MKAPSLVFGCLLALAAASPGLAQPKDERPIKRLRLADGDALAGFDLPSPPFGRLQVLHHTQEALQFNIWNSGLTETGQLVGLTTAGRILVLDLTTGVLIPIEPRETPGLEFLSELDEPHPPKLIVLQHGTGWIRPGNLLALTSDGIYQVDAVDRTARRVAGLEDLPPDEDWRDLWLAERYDGTLCLGGGDEPPGRVWRIDAAHGRLEELPGLPTVRWLPPSFEEGISVLAPIQPLPEGAGKPSVRLALGTDSVLMVEPGGTLAEIRHLGRYDPATGARTWPLRFLPDSALPSNRRLVAVLPDGSWILWGRWESSSCPWDLAQEALFLVSPDDALQTRLEALVREGGCALRTRDRPAWDRVLAALDALGIEHAGVHIATAISSSRGAPFFPRGLGGLIAGYAQAPAPSATRVRIRLARQHLLHQARAMDTRWDDPGAQPEPPLGHARAERKAPPAQPSPLGRLLPLDTWLPEENARLISDGSLVHVDNPMKTITYVDLATGAKATYGPEDMPVEEGWPPLDNATQVVLPQETFGASAGSIFMISEAGLHHLDPRIGLRVHMIEADRFPTHPQLDTGRLLEGWDGNYYLDYPPATQVWQLVARNGAWAFQATENALLPFNPAWCLARLVDQPQGARLVESFEDFPASYAAKYQDLKEPVTPPHPWPAHSVPILTVRLWKGVDGLRPVVEAFFTEPGGTLAEMRCRFRLDPRHGVETRPVDALSWMALPGEKQLAGVLPDGSWLVAHRSHARAGDGLFQSLHLVAPADDLQAELEGLVARGMRAATDANPAELNRVDHLLDVLQGRRSFAPLVSAALAQSHSEGWFPPVLVQVIADYLGTSYETKLRARLARRHLQDWARKANLPLHVPGADGTPGAPALLAVPPPHPAR